MQIIFKDKIDTFIERVEDKDIATLMRMWLRLVEAKDWHGAGELKADFNDIGIFADRIYLFGFLNSTYAIATRIHFSTRQVFVLAVGKAREVISKITSF